MSTPITAPMVGKILEIPVSVGDQVEEDDTVIVMEAMKMEIPVVAPESGTLEEIKVSAGQMLETDEVIGPSAESRWLVVSEDWQHPDSLLIREGWMRHRRRRGGSSDQHHLSSSEEGCQGVASPGSA